MIPRFRAWDNAEKKMWNVETIYIEDEWVKANDGSIYGTTKDLVRDYVLMQSTGLKDKNGTEIYEGDIVKNIYDEIYVVKWLDAGFYLEEKYDGGFDYSELHFGDNKEIVGNIYENPELLEDN